ncbi:hypothetical protein TIFTF001_051805 [Ficus carica]|uniref:Uncharacterized protein n=1 Tax=Ficus carica TaxID=3494 RepID=A0AA88EAN3_FICCA|nr:hypothetical protein TIFTF001_051805 [Ficus carica]
MIRTTPRTDTTPNQIDLQDRILNGFEWNRDPIPNKKHEPWKNVHNSLRPPCTFIHITSRMQQGVQWGDIDDEEEFEEFTGVVIEKPS